MSCKEKVLYDSESNVVTYTDRKRRKTNDSISVVQTAVVLAVRSKNTSAVLPELILTLSCEP